MQTTQPHNSAFKDGIARRRDDCEYFHHNSLAYEEYANNHAWELPSHVLAFMRENAQSSIQIREGLEKEIATLEALPYKLGCFVAFKNTDTLTKWLKNEVEGEGGVKLGVETVMANIAVANRKHPLRWGRIQDYHEYHGYSIVISGDLGLSYYCKPNAMDAYFKAEAPDV